MIKILYYIGWYFNMAEYKEIIEKYETIVQDIKSGVYVMSNESDKPSIENLCIAIWDTGAIHTTISPYWAKTLKLEKIGEDKINTAGGLSSAYLFKCNLLLPDNIYFKDFIVYCSPIGQIDMLIGMDIISLGDLSITNSSGKTEFSFRMPLHIKKPD